MHRKPYSLSKNLLNLISEFSKVAGYKVNIQKSMAFLYTNNELSERESKGKNPTYYSHKKNKVPGGLLLNSLNQLFRISSFFSFLLQQILFAKNGPEILAFLYMNQLKFLLVNGNGGNGGKFEQYFRIGSPLFVL